MQQTYIVTDDYERGLRALIHRWVIQKIGFLLQIGAIPYSGINEIILLNTVGYLINTNSVNSD